MKEKKPGFPFSRPLDEENPMIRILSESVSVLGSFSCVPILYGSLAGEAVLRRSLQAHDVDLLIPSVLLARKPELDQAFQKAGFRLIAAPVPAYEKKGIQVELAEWDKWAVRCGWDSSGVFCPPGFPCPVLDASNLARLYAILEADPERPEAKRRKDALKNALLRDHLQIQFRKG